MAIMSKRKAAALPTPAPTLTDVGVPCSGFDVELVCSGAALVKVLAPSAVVDVRELVEMSEELLTKELDTDANVLDEKVIVEPAGETDVLLIVPQT